MFGKYFYHRFVRTYVYFGTLFNNIEYRRFDKDKNVVNRFRVPLTYV